MGLKRAPNGVPALMMYGTSQDLTFTAGASTACSTAFNAATEVVRVYATVDCRIAFATSPTATATSLYIPAGSYEYFNIKGGDKVAAWGVSAGGTLNIVEATST